MVSLKDTHSSRCTTDVFKENYWFIFFTLAFIGASALLGYLYNQPHLVKFGLYSESFYKMIMSVLLFAFALYLIRIAFFENTASLAGKVFSDIKIYVLNNYNLLSVFMIVVAFPLIVSSMTILKTLLPYVNPYYLDTFFMEMDKTLHFGVAPWRIIQPIVGYPYVTFVINVIYNFWIYLQLIIFVWQMFALNKPKLRMQFLVSYVLVWIVLGSMMAILLSSAGPCFYSQITDLPDPYSPLFQYLRNANDVLAENNLSLWALDAQRYLWEHFVESTVGLGSGISAMPSLHVSVAVLLAFVGWRTNRALGVFLTIHAAFILIGSIHLGWHYAVDGYMSIIATYGIWKFSGFLVRNIPERRTIIFSS